MSIFTRPGIVCAIIFGCFAVLIPRIFLPFFRPRTAQIDDRFRRPTPAVARNIHEDLFEQNSDSPPHMQIQHPGINSLDPSLNEQIASKPAVTFALPMYAVGIAVFFIYTCFKYWAKGNNQEKGMKLQYSTDNIRWNAQKKNFKYQRKSRFDEADDDEEHQEDLYAGLDPDYVEYLKLKRHKEFEAEQAVTTEQRQMHDTLDQMKNSLSFINSKLGVTKATNSLTDNEISQLQERLASTEAQMYQILSALDAASVKMNDITKNTRESLEQSHQPFNRDEDYRLPSRSPSESEGSSNEEENSNSDENSFHQDEPTPFHRNEQDEEEESSSYEEEDDEVPNEIDDEDESDDDDDDESESSSNRYGLMTTNYGSDPTPVDDYELGTIPRPIETDDTQTKVQEWRERHHSQSLGSSNASLDQDQSIPVEEQNLLIQRKHST